MRIVIVGPGALGSLLTARLAQFAVSQAADGTGNEVVDLYLLDYKPERAEHIRESGLLFEEEGQRTRLYIQAEADPAVCSGCDVLFLCVKSISVSDTLARISPFLHRAMLFVAMQNGIGHLEAVSSLPCMNAVGVTSEGATLIAHGHVKHGGKGMTRIGLLGEETGASNQLLADTVQLLTASGLDSALTKNPLKYVWAKLFINVAINALTAIHRCPNGALLDSSSTKDIMEMAVREAIMVARALDIEIEGDPVAAAFKVCQLTTGNISSMHQDVRNRKKTEIDAINGAIVAHGRNLGIATPVNEDLVSQVKSIEASYDS